MSPHLATMTMLCILALLPLAESSAPSPAPSLADALAEAHMADSEAVARVLTEVVQINPTFAIGGGWLADLRGFDEPERQELSDILRKEGVGLADRSKLRRLATGATELTPVQEAADGVWRRAQQAAQADGREESTTNTQLKKQHGDHAVTAQPDREQADGGSGLSGDSASPSLWRCLTSAPRQDIQQNMLVGQALMAGARRSDRVASHGGPRRRGLRGAPSLLMR
jgi:hypothetical protein